MYEGKHIISVTPAGRKRYMRILAPYLLRARDVIDRHVWWVNTDNDEDVQYIHALCEAFPDFFEYRTIDPRPKEFDNYNIHRFFHECTDRNTIYIRFDDDICWIDKDCISNLAKARLENSSDFLVYANIVNNAICSHLHARFGAIDRNGGMPQYNCTCHLGWNSPTYAEKVHRNFLLKIEENTTDDYKFPHLWRMNPGETRVSINAISWHGYEFAKFAGLVGRDEEEWLSLVKPKQLSVGTAIAGNALVSHFAFFTQRKHLESKTTLLEQYQALSQGVLNDINESLPE